MLPELATFASLTILAMSMVVFLRLRQAEKELRRKEQEILGHTRHSATHIVETAKDKALEIISAAQVEAEDDKQDLETSLDKISANQLREFEKALQNISFNLEGSVKVQLDKFRKALELETVQSQKFVADKINKDYEAVLAAIEQHRQQQYARIDDKVKGAVDQIIKNIAGKLIEPSAQQKLILQALEEAKKQHVL